MEKVASVLIKFCVPISSDRLLAVYFLVTLLGGRPVNPSGLDSLIWSFLYWLYNDIDTICAGILKLFWSEWSEYDRKRVWGQCHSLSKLYNM